MDLSIYSLWFLLWAQEAGSQPGLLEEREADYGTEPELEEAGQLVTFVRLATKSDAPCPLKSSEVLNIRITRTLRIFIGPRELKIRPMAKSILLLFLRHPDGIVLKEISNYEHELASLYGRVSRSWDKALIQTRVARIMDVFNNELNVNISRVNSALSAMMMSEDAPHIRGKAGSAKAIILQRNAIIWE